MPLAQNCANKLSCNLLGIRTEVFVDGLLLSAEAQSLCKFVVTTDLTDARGYSLVLCNVYEASTFSCCTVVSRLGNSALDIFQQLKYVQHGRQGAWQGAFRSSVLFIS